jgi:hypothetical protein
MRALPFAPIVSAIFFALAIQVAEAQEQHFVARHGKIVVDVSVSAEPVPMKTIATRDWRSKAAPVIVRVRGTSPPITVWATPAYGAVNLPGRHVDVTYLMRYRADGDRSDAEPRYGGVPLSPDPRRSDGKANVDLPLAGGVHLALVMIVKNGVARTTLRAKGNLAENVVFEP